MPKKKSGGLGNCEDEQTGIAEDQILLLQHFFDALLGRMSENRTRRITDVVIFFDGLSSVQKWKRIARVQGGYFVKNQPKG